MSSSSPVIRLKVSRFNRSFPGGCHPGARRVPARAVLPPGRRTPARGQERPGRTGRKTSPQKIAL